MRSKQAQRRRPAIQSTPPIAPAAPFPTLREAARLWLRIGCLSFGGPAGQIALLHREIVDRRNWVSDQTGRSVEVLATDIATTQGLRAVEYVLATDASLTLLVTTPAHPTPAVTPAALAHRIARTPTAPLRLAYAAAPAFAARRHGTIIIVGSAPHPPNVAATTLALTHALHRQWATAGLRIQAVLPTSARIKPPRRPLQSST